MACLQLRETKHQDWQQPRSGSLSPRAHAVCARHGQLWQPADACGTNTWMKCQLRQALIGPSSCCAEPHRSPTTFGTATLKLVLQAGTRPARGAPSQPSARKPFPEARLSLSMMPFRTPRGLIRCCPPTSCAFSSA